MEQKGPAALYPWNRENAPLITKAKAKLIPAVFSYLAAHFYISYAKIH